MWHWRTWMGRRAAASRSAARVSVAPGSSCVRPPTRLSPVAPPGTVAQRAARLARGRSSIRGQSRASGGDRTSASWIRSRTASRRCSHVSEQPEPSWLIPVSRRLRAADFRTIDRRSYTPPLPCTPGPVRSSTPTPTISGRLGVALVNLAEILLLPTSRGRCDERRRSRRLRRRPHPAAARQVAADARECDRHRPVAAERSWWRFPRGGRSSS